MRLAKPLREGTSELCVSEPVPSHSSACAGLAAASREGRSANSAGPGERGIQSGRQSWRRTDRTTPRAGPDRTAAGVSPEERKAQPRSSQGLAGPGGRLARARGGEAGAGPGGV